MQVGVEACMARAPVTPEGWLDALLTREVVLHSLGLLDSCLAKYLRWLFQAAGRLLPRQAATLVYVALVC